ncbi:MAG TPA: serine/threonine-protein kinase [Thermoanaerobaculia bacterium]|nr:serine/threonine-protein kinase [Thermoanaerobaculia bacterium]
MLAPDSYLGPYKLIARIGAGGMGEVWKGEDTRLGRTVAIKVLPPSVALDAEATARMRREARTAAQLYHPNIAMIHSIEQEGDRIFIVMEFVEGVPLSKIIARGALSEAELCRIGRGVADALAEAHAKGIVHRDIKPDNIMVKGSRVKVLDFGIAKQVGPPTTTSDAPTTFMTQQGMILGTVHYMSPEQALGKDLDGRTDIFSLGVVLYEASTGKLPFTGETATETMMHIIRDDPPDPVKLNNAISPGLKAIIDKCLRKNREERFESAGDLASALEQQLGKASTDPYTAAATQMRAASTVIDRAPAPAPPKRGRWLWLALGAILLAAGIIGAIASRTVTRTPSPKTTTTATTATTASTAPPPASTVTVTAPPPQIIEAKTPPITQSTPPAPKHEELTATTASTAPPPPPPPPDARAHLHEGQRAMYDRNFDVARAEYEAAWLDKEHLDPHDRHFVRLGMAVVNGNRFEARKVGAEIERLWPGDPELERIRREFGEQVPEQGRQPLRPRWRKP